MCLFFLITLIFLIIVDGVARVAGLNGVMPLNYLQASGIVGRVFNIEENGVSIVVLGDVRSFILFDMWDSYSSKFLVDASWYDILKSDFLLFIFFSFFLLFYVLFQRGSFLWLKRFGYRQFIFYIRRFITVCSHLSFFSWLFHFFFHFRLILLGENLYGKKLIRGELDQEIPVSIYWNGHLIGSFSRGIVDDFIQFLNMEYMTLSGNNVGMVRASKGNPWYNVFNPHIVSFLERYYFTFDSGESHYYGDYENNMINLSLYFPTPESLSDFLVFIHRAQCNPFNWGSSPTFNIFIMFLMPFSSYRSNDFSFYASCFVECDWVRFPFRQFYIQFLISFIGFFFFVMRSFSHYTISFYFCFLVFLFFSFYFLRSRFTFKGFIYLLRRYFLIYFLLFFFPFLYGFIGFLFFFCSFIWSFGVFIFETYYKEDFKLP